MEPSCPSVLQFAWGEHTHLAPRSSLEPHGTWSILKHSSGATQSLEDARGLQGNLGYGDPRYWGTQIEPPGASLRDLEHP